MRERADILTFPGICDASAAVAIDEKTIIVGDDERQWLSIYDLRTQQLLDKIPLPFHSGDDSGETDGRREADIEGATIFKGRIVWITSHGRNKSGKVRPDRYRLFASHAIDSRDGKAAQAFSSSFNGVASMILDNGDRSYAPLREAIGDLSRTDAALAPKKQRLQYRRADRDARRRNFADRGAQSSKGCEGPPFRTRRLRPVLTGRSKPACAWTADRDRSWRPGNPRHRLVSGPRKLYHRRRSDR